MRVFLLTILLSLIATSAFADKAGRPNANANCKAFEATGTYNAECNNELPASTDFIAPVQPNGTANPPATILAESNYYAKQVWMGSAVGDLNDDGFDDLVVADYLYLTNMTIAQQDAVRASTPGTISVWYGNGDGTFQDPQKVTVGAYPQAIAMKDFDFDGRLDIAVVASYADAVTLLYNNGDLSFDRIDVATLDTPRSVAAGDMNGDGLADMVVSHSLACSFSVYFNSANGFTGQHEDYATCTTVTLRSQDGIHLFDADNDADLDVTVVGNGGLHVFRNTGGKLALASKTSQNGYVVRSFDADQDGDLDLVTQSGSYYYTISFNDGKGVFRLIGQYQTAYPSPRDVRSKVVIEDFNGDGYLDVMSAGFADSKATISYGQKATPNAYGKLLILGTVQNLPLKHPTSTTMPFRPVLADSGDFDGDGLVDIVVGGYQYDAGLQVFFNAGF